MKTFQFSYTSDFACLAGECPDTCCRDWEIALDEAALSRYQAMPGALGEEVRAAIEDDDGPCFRLKGGFCPFLNDAGLCRIQLAHGPEALTRNCDYFPRFYEEYGATRELSLSPACPEAARLLLEAPTLELVSEDEARPVEPNDLDPTLYLGLKRLRTEAMRLVQDASLSLTERMERLLALCESAQKRLDSGTYGALHLVHVPARVKKLRLDAGKLAEFLGTLEQLRPDWRAILAMGPIGAPDEAAAARYLGYYLFRYFLKAVNDDALLPRVRAGVCGAVLLCRLTAAGVSAETALYRYVREVEHNPGNFEALQNWEW